jgi:hypothetical protein
MATNPKATKSPSLSTQSEGSGTQAEGIATVLKDPKETGEGTRIIILGASRRGKSTLCKKLVQAILDEGIAERLIVHDQKYPDHAQYEGAKASDAATLRQAFLQARSIVARGEIPAEDCARLTREGAEGQIKTCLLLDEGSFALKKNDDGEPIDRAWQGGDLAWLQLQGGGVGASSVTLWQMPKQCPGSALDNASATICFALGGRSLAYTRDLRIIPPEAQETVIALQIGQFCVFFQDREWDQRTYGPA